MSEKHRRPNQADAGIDTNIDVFEYGGERDGQRQQMNRRLFMQLQVWRAPDELSSDAARDQLLSRLRERNVPAVVYADAQDAQGYGLLTWSEDPSYFVDEVRPALAGGLANWLRRDDFSMFGRTYASGYEPDLEYWILHRPVETASNEAWPWAIWYPLRRGGHFEDLEPREQGKVLKEHAIIGRAYGTKDLAHDIRLASHGLDTSDNDFVIGLIGKDLHPLSHVVQRMRRTQQTRQYLTSLGPFFVGKVIARTV